MVFEQVRDSRSESLGLARSGRCKNLNHRSGRGHCRSLSGVETSQYMFHVIEQTSSPLRTTRQEDGGEGATWKHLVTWSADLPVWTLSRGSRNPKHGSDPKNVSQASAP
jgi:hypothetical protein